MSDPRFAGEHLDLEVLSAYVDNRLAAGPRARVEEHLSDCDRCREVWRGVASALVSDKLRLRATSRWSVLNSRALQTAAAVIVLLCGLGGLWWWFSRDAIGNALDTLANVPRNQRMTVARVSIEREWAPAPRVLRGGALGDPLLAEARSAIEHATKGRETTRALSARALAELSVPNPAAAIALFKHADTLGDLTSEEHADFAAALIENFRINESAADLQSALAELSRALAGSPRLPSALFNRAIALELSGDRTNAAMAWTAYLAVDSTSGWATEARSRLAG